VAGNRSTEEFYAKDRKALRAWLKRNHEQRTTGIWLVYDKGEARTFPYEAIAEECLCVGWIDSQAKSHSDTRSMIWISPRKPRSVWSRPNKERVERLTRAGLMLPAGLAVVEAAKRSGAWTSLDDVEDGVEPDDLRAALDKKPKARAGWDALSLSARKVALQQIAAARRPETRAKRVAQTVADAAAGRRPGEWRPPTG
jgi:uncharacterized protein YdeI (YjbR/CyaY-like superfamily)